jgi:hypothetical protein
MSDQKPTLDYGRPPRKRRKWVIGIGVVSVLAVMWLLRVMTRSAPAPMPATVLPATTLPATMSIDDIRQAITDVREGRHPETQQYHVILELSDGTTRPADQ